MSEPSFESLPLLLTTQQSPTTPLTASKIVTLDTIPDRLSPLHHPMQLCVGGSWSPASRPPKLRMPRGKYFAPNLFHIFSVMSTILPIGPLECDKIADLHNRNFTGCNTESLRRKYTSTHRCKAPTWEPDSPPEIREAKLVKMAIGNKTELANCGEEYDMEV